MALLDGDAVDRGLADLDWRREGDAIVRTWKGKDFVAALAFVNEVGEKAEAANHHPDIDIRWNTVVLRLSTHSEGGITDKDLALAADIDAVGFAP